MRRGGETQNSNRRRRRRNRHETDAPYPSRSHTFHTFASASETNANIDSVAFRRLATSPSPNRRVWSFLATRASPTASSADATMEEDDFVGIRRSTRAALAEIPTRLGQLRVSPPPTPWTPITAIPAPPSPATPRYALTPNTRDNTPASLPSSAFISPTPSPDELVIQQRGRKRIPAWSPDIDNRKQISNSTLRTPPKGVLAITSPSKNVIVLRSTPKKRLLLNEFDKVNGSPKKADTQTSMTPVKTRNQSPSKALSVPKKPKIEHKATVDANTPLDVILKAMSSDQLIDIVKNIVQRHPQVEQEVRNELPMPDLKPLEEKLLYLKRNIFRSLPASRLTSKTDSPAYSRAATHLVAFKKHLVEQGRILSESQHWESVLEYAAISWPYVKATPLWDNHPHNTVRKQCFKYLTSLFMNALKKGKFDEATLKDTYEKMESMVTDSNDINLCMKWIDEYLKAN